MDPITNVDRLILLLRQRLQERDTIRRSPRGSSRKAEARAEGVSAAQALAALEDVDDRQLRRALIQGLLSDHFGRHLINEAKFQQMVDRVVTAIEGDDVGKALLDRMTTELRDQAR
jgi:hypothetical protein